MSSSRIVLLVGAVFVAVWVLCGGIQATQEAWHNRTIRCNGYVIMPVHLPVLASRLILDRKDDREWEEALYNPGFDCQYRNAWTVSGLDEAKSAREWYEAEGKVGNAFLAQSDAVAVARSIGHDESSTIKCIDYHRCGDYSFQYDGCRVIKRADVVVGYWKYLPKDLTKPDHEFDWKVRPVDMNGNEWNWVEDYYRIPPKTPFRWRFTWTDNGKPCLDPGLTAMRMDTSSSVVEKLGDTFTGKPGTVAHFCGCTSALVDFGGNRPKTTVSREQTKWGMSWVVRVDGMGAGDYASKRNADAAARAVNDAYDRQETLLEMRDHGNRVEAGRITVIRQNGDGVYRMYLGQKKIGRVAAYLGPQLKADFN